MVSALLDTNILIYHLGGILSIPFDSGRFAISSLTIFELLQLPGMSFEEENHIRSLVSECITVSTSETIAERAAILARTHRIGSIDFLIAATALELDVPLVTQNVKDFKRIDGLSVKNRV